MILSQRQGFSWLPIDLPPGRRLLWHLPPRARHARSLSKGLDGDKSRSKHRVCHGRAISVRSSFVALLSRTYVSHLAAVFLGRILSGGLRESVVERPTTTRAVSTR